jgi:methyl-accepting chemotaxis protein
LTTTVSTALNEIVEKARQMDDLAASLAAASKEQSVGITQVNLAMGQIDQVTQRNAAGAEECAAAAEELNIQAQSMRGSVSDLMKLVGNASAPAKPEHPRLNPPPARKRLAGPSRPLARSSRACQEAELDWR